jgi:hypothetical protein
MIFLVDRMKNRKRKIATKKSNEPGQQRKRTENRTERRRTMRQKGAMSENTKKNNGQKIRQQVPTMEST